MGVYEAFRCSRAGRVRSGEAYLNRGRSEPVLECGPRSTGVQTPINMTPSALVSRLKWKLDQNMLIIVLFCFCLSFV